MDQNYRVWVSELTVRTPSGKPHRMHALGETRPEARSNVQAEWRKTFGDESVANVVAWTTYPKQRTVLLLTDREGPIRATVTLSHKGSDRSSFVLRTSKGFCGVLSKGLLRNMLRTGVKIVGRVSEPAAREWL